MVTEFWGGEKKAKKGAAGKKIAWNAVIRKVKVIYSYQTKKWTYEEGNRIPENENHSRDNVFCKNRCLPAGPSMNSNNGS